MAKKRTEWDGTPEGMERLKAENPGLLMVAVENHTEDNFLVFATQEDIEAATPSTPPPKSIEERIAELEIKVAALTAPNRL